MDPSNGFDGSGVAGRRRARAVLVGGVLLTLLYAFAFVAAPDFPGGPGRSDAWGAAVLWIGLAMPVVGLGWIVGIYRRAFGPEPNPDGWRYRASR